MTRSSASDIGACVRTAKRVRCGGAAHTGFGARGILSNRVERGKWPCVASVHPSLSNPERPPNYTITQEILYKNLLLDAKIAYDNTVYGKLLERKGISLDE
jgi:hypothetical protein